MAGPIEAWTSTPNKKDNLTSGWASKTLFNFQSPTSDIQVDHTYEVFEEIIGVGKNYKGTNILPANYFAADNTGDSRTFKITMLFDKFLDGNDMNFNLGLYDIDNSTSFEIGPRTLTGIRDTGSGAVNLSKLEYYCCVYLDNGADLIMSINGTIMYEKDGANSGTAIIEPFNGYATLTNGVMVSYSFSILNKCGDKIAIYSLVVEELG
jgi:hypothetical protein